MSIQQPQSLNKLFYTCICIEKEKEKEKAKIFSGAVDIDYGMN